MADIRLEQLAESVAAKQIPLVEGNPRRKFERKLNDRSNVHEFIVLTSQNPHFPDVVDKGEDTTEPLESIKRELRRGNFGWVPIRGVYGGDERSFLVPNMTAEEAIRLCRRYGQESFIQGIREEDGGMLYRFWMTEDGKNYSVFKEKDRYDIMDDDAEDMFSDRRGFKFQIPFFESIELAIHDFDRHLVEKCSRHMGYSERKKWIAESMDPKVKGSTRWFCRGMAYETDEHFYNSKH